MIRSECGQRHVAHDGQHDMPDRCHGARLGRRRQTIMIVPSTRKISTAAGMMPHAHFTSSAHAEQGPRDRRQRIRLHQGKVKV